MPASGIKLADANVWLALAFSDHIHHRKAVHWFDAQLDGSCAFCRVTQMALLRHLTNSKIMGKFVQSQQEAWSAYDKLLADTRIIFIAEPSGIDIEFRGFSQSPAPSHQRWTDAYLAAFSIIIQAQLVSFDGGFQSFSGLDVCLLT